MNAANNPGATGSNNLSLPPVKPTPSTEGSPSNKEEAATPTQQTPAPVAPTAPTASGGTPQIQQAQLSASPSQGAQQTATDSGIPAIADDTDLIEKEWVEKAKQLVDKTKNDPYVQNKEMSKFKATYIKKRYNKDIKLNKD